MFNSKFLKLPKIIDQRGNLTFLQYPQQVPFEIKRVFWTYNAPCGKIGSGHAFVIQEEVIVSLSGSFDVVIIDFHGNQERIHLNRSFEALYLPPKTWRYLENFSKNAVSLHLLNGFYDENDYIKNFDEFSKLNL
jgi:hypothetical protein